MKLGKYILATWDQVIHDQKKLWLILVVKK